MTPDRLAAITWTFKLDWSGRYVVDSAVWSAWLALAYDHPTLTRLHQNKAAKGGIVFG